MKNIKELVENENYTIVFDTNILLSVYVYSPEFSEFIISCLNEIVSYTYLPATVALEFKRNYKKSYRDMKNRIKSVTDKVSNTNKKASESFLKGIEELEKYKFDDVQNLKSEVEIKLTEIQKIFEKYFDDRNILDLINDYWTEDNGFCLFERFENDNRIMDSLTQEDLYRICDDGTNRYREKRPPGFKDKKDGIRKYSDLIIWHELMNFAKKSNNNIIFVTNDSKPDWWQNDGNILNLHHLLVEEFEKETGQKILAYNLVDFLSIISDEYSIEQVDIVKLALDMTDKNYIERISSVIEQNIFEELEVKLENNIDSNILKHIGSEGIDSGSIEINSLDFKSGKQLDRYEDNVIYELIYNTEVSCISYDYWGRDDDSREIVTSPGNEHIFSGTIKVNIERTVDKFLYFEDDSTFDDIEFVDSKLIETWFKEWFEDEYYDDNEYYTNCPDCGDGINHENDAGTGFCIKCSKDH